MENILHKGKIYCMRNDEIRFRDYIFEMLDEFNDDLSEYEVGVNFPQSQAIQSDSVDKRFSKYVKERESVSEIETSNQVVIERLKEEYIDRLPKAIYWMTLNIGYDWARQYKLLVSAGFKVTKNQIRKDVKQCLDDYHNRRREKLLSFTHFKKAA